MGNNVTTTIEKWGVDPKKLKLRNKKRKEKPTPPQQTADAHLYDTVPEEPLYAKVNKKRQPEEEIHYAEIQVVQSTQMASRERQRPPPVGSTEYATIDFNNTTHTSQTTHTKAPVSIQPADILIPPGALQKPKSKSHSKRSRYSERAVLV